MKGRTVIIFVTLALLSIIATCKAASVPAPVPLYTINGTLGGTFINDTVFAYSAYGLYSYDKRLNYIAFTHDFVLKYAPTGQTIYSYINTQYSGIVFDLTNHKIIWTRRGVFSGDGRYFVESFLYDRPGWYSIGSRVVDLLTMKTYPINVPRWYYDHYYVSYHAKYILVAEEPDLGGSAYADYWAHVLLLKFNGSAYNVVWKSPPVAKGRVNAIYMTENGKWILYANNTVIHIAENNNGSVKILANITVPVSGGYGIVKLYATDPYKIGYLVVGTSNGRIYIYNTNNGTDLSNLAPCMVVDLCSLENLSLTKLKYLYVDKFASYRYPNGIVLIAFRAWTPSETLHCAGFIDLAEHTVVANVFHTTLYEEGSVAFSSTGRFAFVDNKMYYIVYTTRTPHLRFDGVFKCSPSLNKPWELSRRFIFTTPTDKPYKAFFDGGKIVVTYLSSSARPVQLVTDKTVRLGLLNKLYQRGLIKTAVIYTDGGYVTDNKFYVADEHTVIYSRVHVLQRWTYLRFVGVPASTVDSGVVIEIPLGKTITPFSNLSMNVGLSVTWVAPIFAWNGNLIGIAGVSYSPKEATGTAMALAKNYGELYLREALSSFNSSAVSGAMNLYQQLLSRMVMAGMQVPVGACFLLDAYMNFYTHYQDLQPYMGYKATLYVIPILEDMKTHELYAVADYMLPRSAYQHANDYKEHVISYIEKTEHIPADHIGIRVDYIAGTWKDYENKIATGHLHPVNILDLVESLLPVPPERLKIVKILIVADMITQGYASTFDLLGGGFKVPVGTIVHADYIDVYGYMPAFNTSNPVRIAQVLQGVDVNGRWYPFHAGKTGAVAEFILPSDTPVLCITFPNASYMRAVLHLYLDGHVDIPMVKENGYYQCKFHWDWKAFGGNVSFFEERCEFMDMPYPMTYAERIETFRWGTDILNITKYFRLWYVINDTTSPTGKRYYYITFKNMTFIDPSDGGILEYCKHFIFRYWYVEPPKVYRPKLNATFPINGTKVLQSNYTSAVGDAWLKLYLNGTTNTSTIPRMLVVWLGATGRENNTITIAINMSAGYLNKQDRPVYTLRSNRTYTVTVPANHSYVMQINIQKFIAEAISHAPRGFFEAQASIIKATEDEIKANDYDRVVYFPPTVFKPSVPVTLTVKVINGITRAPITGAKVYLDDQLFGVTSNGTVSGSTLTGFHRLKVEATGYKTFEKDINVFDNMTYVVELLPENATGYKLLQVLVQYNDGYPFYGANVTVIDNKTGTVLFTDTTDSVGLAEFYLPEGKVVDVRITAGNYSMNFTGIVMDQDQKVVFTLPVNSPYFQPEVAIAGVRILVHQGLGWFYGKVKHYVKVYVYSNVPQTVTLLVRLYNESSGQTIAEKTITVKLHRGLNVIRTWLPVAVRNESTEATVMAKIVNYQFDTNLENNMMVGNTVMLKPFADVSVTVLWKPLRQKVKFAILPGDLIEVDVGFMIPCKLKHVVGNITVLEDTMTHGMKVMNRFKRIMSTMKPNTTIWYNFTITVPFTDKIVVRATVYHPWDMNGLNNNASVVIHVFPDNKVVFAKPAVLMVQSGGTVPVTVHIKSNAIGSGLTVSVVDMNTHDLVGLRYITIKKPDFYVTVNGKAPAISGFSAVHTWNASISAADFYLPDNYVTFNVRIWNLPWWTWALAAIIGILIVIAIIKSVLKILLTTRYPRRFRFYRRKSGGEGGISRFEHSVEGGGDEFRYYRRKT